MADKAKKTDGVHTLMRIGGPRDFEVEGYKTEKAAKEALKGRSVPGDADTKTWQYVLIEV